MKSILSKLFVAIASVAAASLVFAACNKEKEPAVVPPFVPTEPVPEIVDLGLPSGTCWASFNLGASSRGEKGKYYAWGETEAKSEFTLENYLLRESGTSEDDVKFKKYVFDGDPGKNHGTIDDKKSLESSDDAAHVHLGGNWYTPTVYQISELFSNCSRQEETINGQKGVLLTSTVKGYQDKMIFLPLTGLYVDEALNLEEKSVSMSASLDATYCYSARFYACDVAGNLNQYKHYRWNGYPIRPVYYVRVERMTMSAPTVSLPIGAEPLQLVFTIYPSDATRKDVNYTSSNNNVATVDGNGKVTAVSIGKAIITITANDGSNVSTSCEVNVVPDVAVPEAVDLGLPSGTRWASFDLGATRPQDPGAYFAWGETGTKTDYSWDQYKFWVSGSQSSDLKFSKYVTDAQYGTVDGMSSLAVKDDPACYHLGGNWRTPTCEQIKELVDKCKIVWGGDIITFTNEENGRSIVFATNSNYMDGTTISAHMSWSCYWSNELNATENERAYIMKLDSESETPYSKSKLSRKYGALVRPVLKIE